MKKYFTAILSVLFIFCTVFVMSACSDDSELQLGDEIVLNVYNWGEYISDGSEDSFDSNSAFEEYCRSQGLNVRVNYSTFDSNESMYNKLESGAVSYDIVVPSEYMIERMIQEDMLEKIDISKISNYQYIYDRFKTIGGEEFDADNVYHVPYFCGYVGIIYNTKYVSEADVASQSWDLLFNEKYDGKILQFNNSRDAFGTVMYKNGIDVNTTDITKWESCVDELKNQKPLLQSYVMDEIFNKMKNESAWIAAYYAGDFLSMYEENENLAFYFPKEGTNVFFDGMCIPKGSKNKEIAQMYIDFMISEEPAVANAEFVYYASPNKLVNENEEYIAYMNDVYENASDILDPTFEEGYITSYYANLDPKLLEKVNDLWVDIKIYSSIEAWVYVADALIIGAIITLVAVKFVKKKRRLY